MRLVLLLNATLGRPALGPHLGTLVREWGDVLVCRHARPGPVGRLLRRVVPMVPASAFVRSGGGYREVNIYGLSDEVVASLWGGNAHVLCCGFSRILSAGLLAGTRSAANVHPSLLPWYRGPDPVAWVLHYGECVTGVSVHEMTPAIDRGPVYRRREVAIPPGADEAQLTRALHPVIAALALDYLSTRRQAACPPRLPPLERCPYQNAVSYRGFPQD